MTGQKNRRGRVKWHTVRALLRKQAQEWTSAFKTGHFDVPGFVLRIVIIAAIVGMFAVFFGRFVGVYVEVKQNGQADLVARATELLTIFYFAVIFGMVVGCIGQLGKELFASDDLKIYAGLSLNENTLFVAKLISIYVSQWAAGLVALLTVNCTFAAKVSVTGAFWAYTAVICFILPLITIAISAALVMPYQMVKRFLKERYVLTFVLITCLLGVAFWLYSRVLGGVKQLLLGDNIRYFFNEKVMTAIGNVCKWLYPARWFANIMTGADLVYGWLWIAGVAALCLVFALLVTQRILRLALQSRNQGVAVPTLKSAKLTKKSKKFGALLKKEFLLIFRTPSYMFSYLSMGLVMPLMVYSCMELGGSLVESLIGCNINLEIALSLTVLFGSLTNIFCATNISRDGMMFYSVKALPVNFKAVFYSKIVLCLVVSCVSNAASAVVLAATGNVGVADALFIFAMGMLFAFVNIAVATRYDFDHARFSAEEDGEIKESTNTVSAIILMGMVLSFAVGGSVVLLKVAAQLHGWNYGAATYLMTAGIAFAAAGIATFYLMFRLGTRYYEFTEGEF